MRESRTRDPITDDHLLRMGFSTELARLERDGEIVICSASPDLICDRLIEAVLTVAPNSGLTSLELMGVRSLLFHAIHDKGFFDFEMPTLTGFTAEEFATIIEKLPRG